MRGELYSPLEVQHENRNRQRKDRDRKSNQRRWKNLRIEEICRIQSKSRCLRKQSQKELRIDQWGACDTPEVWRSDSMSIKPQKEKENKGNKSFHRQKTSRYERLREERAKIILSRKNAIHMIDKGLFAVQSQTGIRQYRVEWSKDRWICNCPDFIKNKTPCKHIFAVEHYLIEYVTVEGEEPKAETITYSQNWPAYNMAQAHEIELFDHLLSELVSIVEEPEQRMGRPRLMLSDRIFCSVMKVYSQLSSRRAQCLYYQALERQQLSHAPHFNAVIKTLLKPEITPILHELVHQSARPLASIETDFATDSSGFRCSSFGRYCEYAHGTKRMHNWLKCHISTGVTTNIVADVIITDEYGADSPQFEPLVRGTAQNFTINEVSADGIYSSRKNLQIVDSYGGTAYIPFKKNATGRSSGALWKKAFHYFQLHRDEFDEHYHKRSNAESTFSAIKKKFGETLKSRKRTAQVNEMLCKIIAYNITVLIHAMFELGITPNFI